jgi:FtsP/CotA-like multicopper oxidase with cupredoxin domain
MRGMNTQGFDILEIRPDSNRRASLVIPEQLTTIPRLEATAALRTRRFELKMGNGPRSGGDLGPGLGRRNGFGGGFGGGRYSINGRQMDMHYINERVPLDDIEIWEIYNSSVMTHPFHIHDVQFEILDRDGELPSLNERGLKDTVKVFPLQTVRLLLRFTDYADEENPYMYHCHMLEHEDRGMMGMFVVVP